MTPESIAGFTVPEKQLQELFAALEDATAAEPVRIPPLHVIRVERVPVGANGARKAA